MANVYNYLCLAYEKANLLSDSLEAGREAIRISKLCKSMALMNTAYHNTKITCKKMGLYQEAAIYEKEMRKLTEVENRKRKILRK